MEFRVLSKNTWVPDSGKDTVYLKIDHWNDFSFITMFHMSLHDEDGQLHDIGEIKIGFYGQTIETDTYDKLPNRFESIGGEFFSLGQGINFYRNMASLPKELCNHVLSALHDIVIQPDLIENIKEEEVGK